MSEAEVSGKAAGKRGGKTGPRPDSEPDFEASLRRLEAIVGRLEAGELPLEETLRLFEEGQALVRGCGSLLERAEQRVKELVEGTGGGARRRDLGSGPDGRGRRGFRRRRIRRARPGRGGSGAAPDREGAR